MNNTNLESSTLISRTVVTVNVLIFAIRDQKLKVLLVKRAVEPFLDYWSLPGGVVFTKESLDDAATRLLSEKTGVKNVYLEQLYTFGDPKRDPRERRIAVTYYALISKPNLKLLAGGTAKEVKWESLDKLPKLAFDHRKIVDMGYVRLKNKVGYSNVVFGLLRDKFRLSELQKAYEIILGHAMDKRNFRKQMSQLGLLEKTGEKEIDGAHRPALLYKFKKKEVVFFS